MNFRTCLRQVNTYQRHSGALSTLFIILFISFISNTRAYAQQIELNNNREIIIQCSGDSVIKWNETIIPGTIYFKSKNQVVYPAFTLIDNEITINCNTLDSKDDSISMFFKVFPYSFHERITLWDSADIQIVEGDVYYNPVQQKPKEELIESTGLAYDGALTRGFSIGNNQSLVFDSELNLQLGGKIGDGYEIRAAITDNNLPIQPDGTTRQLQEFDKVYVEIKKDQHAILAGDFDALSPQGYFLKYNRKLKGAQYTYAGIPYDQPWSIKGSAAISRGKFTRQSIIPTEGNQGPYPLRGENGELFIIILAGSEKVFIDGQLMVRGEDDDYIMDYNQSEITFTRNILINSRHRITIEFEYAQFNFQKSHNALDASYQKNNLKTYINFFQENDSKSVTGDLELTQEDLAILQMAGDAGDQFYKSGIRENPEGFNTNAIFYSRKDTTVMGNVFQDILAWSTHPQEANLIVNFSEVGAGNGHYIISQNPSPNGRIYEWVAPDPVTGRPSGNFDPVIPLQAPQQKQLLTIGAETLINKTGKAGIEVGLSRQDLNRYSSVDDQNNNGIAAKINLVNKFAIGPKWFFSPFLHYETSTQNFRVIDPYRNPEFVRDWNLQSILPVTNEHLPVVGFRIGKNDKMFTQYKYEGLYRGETYTGQRHTGRVLYDTAGWKIEGLLGMLKSQDPSNRTLFFRPAFNIERVVFKKGNWRIGTLFFEDKNEVREIQTDTLRATSFIQNRYSIYFKNDIQADNHFLFSYHQERPKLPFQNEFKLTEKVNEWSVGGHFHKWKNINLEYTLKQRNVSPILTPIENTSKNLLGRVDLRTELFRKGIKWSIGYEIGNGQEPKVEYKYIKVQKGEGLYTWVDDGNGIEELNEFEEAPFADQGEYIRLNIFNNNFIRTRALGMQQTINADLKNIFPKSVLSKVAALSTYQLHRKVREDNASPYWNPFYQEYPDTAVLIHSNTFRNILYWNRSSTVYDIQLGNILQKNQVLQTSGFEIRNNVEQTFRARVSLRKKMDIVFNMRTGERSNTSQFFQSRNYSISLFEAGPEVNVILKDKFRLTGLYQILMQENKEGLEKYASDKFTLEGIWRKSAAMDFRIQGSFVNIDYTSMGNTNVDFTLLQGLQDGTNILWTLQSNTRLTKTLILTVQYNGRKTGEVRTIHTGTAQVRASF